MKINDFEIFIQLNKDYEKICEEYSEDRIFGIFAFGKVNSTAGISSLEELTREIIIFPEFEDVCLNLPPIKEFREGGNLVVKDIRHIYNDLIGIENGLLNEALNTDYRIINMKYQKLFDTYMFKNKDKMAGVIIGDTEAVNHLKHSITEILRIVFNENSTSIKFIKTLTDSEKLGLSAIIEKLGSEGEGIISITKLCQNKDISRYVLDGLLHKLKEYKLAHITSIGPHGTFIKITDYRLLNF